MRKLLALICVVLLAGCGSPGTPQSTAKKATGPSKVVAVTDATFEKEVLKNSGPVVVDLWAVWCAPCRILGPVMDELSDEMDGKIKFVKVDIDKNKATAEQMKAEGIPLLIIFKDGKELDRSVGVLPKEELRKWLESKIK